MSAGTDSISFKECKQNLKDKFQNTSNSSKEDAESTEFLFSISGSTTTVYEVSTRPCDPTKVV